MASVHGTCQTTSYNAYQGTSYNAYRNHFCQNGVQVAGLVIGIRVVSCLFVVSFPLFISGACNLAFGLDDDFGSDGQVVIGAVLLAVASLFSITAIVVCCVGYRSYKNTTITNPGQPYNPNAAYLNGSSMPYQGNPYPSAGTPAYGPGTGFTSQYNYSPSAMTGAPYQPPPPAGFPEKPGGLPPPPAYDAPNPSAPKF